MKHSLSLHLPLSVIAATALLAWTSPASADEPHGPSYDWTCSEELKQDFAVQTPNVLIMLDSSGSMGTSTGDGRTRWWHAKNAINRVATDGLAPLEQGKPPTANFGLGDFSGEGQAGVNIPLECKAARDGQPGTSAKDIEKQLNLWKASGNTPTGDAIRLAANHSCLKPSDGRPAASIIVNDGEPNRGSSSYTSKKQYAINEACNHRVRGPVFVVGFGSGAGVNYNNVLAAAGGTGSCSNGDPCNDLPGSHSATPYTKYEGKCTGAIQADDGDALMKALTDITATLACTFSIDFIGAPEAVTSVPDDAENKYEYFAVGVYTDGVNKLNICHENHPHIATASSACFNANHPDHHECRCDNEQPGQGWRFTSSDQNFVEMSEHYCENINNYEYESGSTHLACVCDPEIVGTRCEMPNWTYEDATTCPEGNYVCHNGKEVCEPDTDCCPAGEACDTGLLGVCADGTIVCDGSHPLGVCVPNEEPSAEVCDNLDNDCDGEIDEDLDGHHCTTGDPGRCGEGLTECVDGVPYCHALGAMPEVCNGVDDDCDGIIDNMDASWKSSAYEEIRAGLTMEQQAATCNFSDVCVCPDGPADVSLAGTWDDFIAEYYPHCVCGSALEPSSTAGAPASLGDSTGGSTGDSAAPAAACSTAGGAQGGLAVLFGFALVALRRRF